jgi:hypothetical protein
MAFAKMNIRYRNVKRRALHLQDKLKEREEEALTKQDLVNILDVIIEGFQALEWANEDKPDI